MLAMTMDVPRPAARLRVLQDGAQDCSTCMNIANCWQPRRVKLSPGDVVTNLLVCRIQRNIDRDKSCRMFLALVRPKVRKMAMWVAGATGASVDEVVTDMESVVVESVLAHYVMGELVPPLVWLFHPRHGAIRHWAVRTVERATREREQSFVYEPADLEQSVATLNRRATGIRSAPALPVPDEPVDLDEADRYRKALAVVDDGVTLTAVEHRVMKFCLANARGNERMTDWLHQRMALALGMQRKDVSRIYAIASRKIVEAVGLRERFLRARGIVAPKCRTDRSRPLTADEVIAALDMLETSRGRATILDVAWALGITDGKLHQLRRQFGGMTPDEIRKVLRR